MDVDDLAKKITFAKGGFCLSNIIDTTDNFL